MIDDDNLSPRKRRKLDELDAMISDQDRVAKEAEERHMQELGALLDQAVEREAEQLGDAIAAEQLGDAIAANLDVLEARLRDLDLLSDGDDFNRLYVASPSTDEHVVGIEVGERRYAFGGAGAGDVLIVRQKNGGRYQDAVLDENGSSIKWHDALPPRPREPRLN